MASSGNGEARRRAASRCQRLINHSPRFYEVLAMNLGLEGDMSSFHRADLPLFQFQTGCMCISAEVPVLGIYALCR